MNRPICSVPLCSGDARRVIGSSFDQERNTFVALTGARREPAVLRRPGSDPSFNIPRPAYGRPPTQRTVLLSYPKRALILGKFLPETTSEVLLHRFGRWKFWFYSRFARYSLVSAFRAPTTTRASPHVGRVPHHGHWHWTMDTNRTRTRSTRTARNARMHVQTWNIPNECTYLQCWCLFFAKGFLTIQSNYELCVKAGKGSTLQKFLWRYEVSTLMPVEWTFEIKIKRTTANDLLNTIMTIFSRGDEG